ncbi:hypothetical protein [Algoriphagus sp.]|uniref:hypothetical protein n=1 Tax=Algoriphagus sp. TaxID=1872435 RepID=UPI00391D743C
MRNLVVWFFIGPIGFGFSSCEKSKNDRFVFNQTELINKADGNIPPCLECLNKIVIFHDFSNSGFFAFSSRFIDWNSFKQDFPKVGVITYLSGQDKIEAINGMKEVNFPYEVYFDSTFTFYETNIILQQFPFEGKHHQVYFVKGDQILDYGNFGMVDVFFKDLYKFFY